MDVRLIRGVSSLDFIGSAWAWLPEECSAMFVALRPDVQRRCLCRHQRDVALMIMVLTCVFQSISLKISAINSIK